MRWSQILEAKSCYTLDKCKFRRSSDQSRAAKFFHIPLYNTHLSRV